MQIIYRSQDLMLYVHDVGLIWRTMTNHLAASHSYKGCQIKLGIRLLMNIVLLFVYELYR